MSKVLENLYLGGIKASRDFINIDMVVNCTKDVPFFSQNAVQIRIPVDDNGESNDLLFDMIKNNVVFEQMDQMLRNNKSVLCHCFAGQQRSATVVACFFMWKYHVSPTEAIEFIQSKRREAFFGSINFLSTIGRYNTLLKN